MGAEMMLRHRISFARRSSRPPAATPEARSAHPRSTQAADPGRARPGAPTYATSQTHSRTPQLSNSAIEQIAAHSHRCSNTIRTARSRTSGEYVIGLPMTPLSPN